MRQVMTTIAELAGATLVTIGAFQIAQPLGLVVGGVFLIVGGTLEADR